MRTTITFIFFLITHLATAQELTGLELLDKAIKYHDPNNQWSTFSGTLNVVMNMPDKEDRISVIDIDIPAEAFQLNTTRGDVRYTQHMKNDSCSYTMNGSSDISEEDLQNYRLTCSRTTLMKNYYTYLYGLPMKLKDPGTIIDSVVQEKTFNDKLYKVLRVTYDANVGKDIWYFYFDPQTYAMEVYQFFKNEVKNDGEYILLSGEEVISGVKMPKNRAWYYNSNNGYLATDILNK